MTRSLNEQVAGLGAVAARLPQDTAWVIMRAAGDVPVLIVRPGIQVAYAVNGYDLWNGDTLAETDLSAEVAAEALMRE